MAKNKIKKVVKVSNEETEMKIRTLLIIFTIIIALCIGLYFLTEKVILKKDRESSSETPEVVEGSRNILLSNLLKQSNKEYYVLVYDYKDKYVSFFKELIDGYRDDYKVKLYTSDLNERLNKKYLSEKGNSKAETTEDLKINGPTLIKVIDKKITKYIEGEPKIKAELSFNE